MQQPNKHQVVAKIEFLENQLTDLTHHLPETYEYILGRLDHQKRILAELEVAENFELIENQSDT